jgi:hypothetical protein
MDSLEVFAHHAEAKRDYATIVAELNTLQLRVRKLEADKRLAEMNMSRKWRVSSARSDLKPSQ